MTTKWAEYHANQTGRTCIRQSQIIGPHGKKHTLEAFFFCLGLGLALRERLALLLWLLLLLLAGLLLRGLRERELRALTTRLALGVAFFGLAGEASVTINEQGNVRNRSNAKQQLNGQMIALDGELAKTAWLGK